jgi:chemotaxis signal transduction protein
MPVAAALSREAPSLEALVCLLDAELAASRPRDEDVSPARLDASEQLIRFAVGQTIFAVAADQMAEVDAVPRLTFVPRVSHAVRGLANLRGEVIVVVDLVRFFAVDEAVIEERERRMIVVRDAGRGRPGGVIVDRVFGITPFAHDPIHARTTDIPVVARPYVVGHAWIDGEDVAVIDLRAVTSSVVASEAGNRES